MQKIISYLVENHGILDLLKEGKVSLIGVSNEEVTAILDAFEIDITSKLYLWK
ncbi:competence pheromone ComX [Solibacillus cecembensis]|uniref:competence pheromone ComX n=1 Tax=Solibacillus cecembensis TaxID=459347 RepID=UPI0009FAAC96